ncbi:hypothetical protein D3C86_1510930 [compost metagenome]
MILLIAAVVGFGDTGSTRSPINALANEDLPALNAPNSAIVNVRCRRRSAFSRMERASDRIDGSPSMRAEAACKSAALRSMRRPCSPEVNAVGVGAAAASAGAAAVRPAAAVTDDAAACKIISMEVTCRLAPLNGAPAGSSMAV